MRKVQHVIVGAGLAGLVAARFLRDEDVVVLDPNPGGYKIGESLIPEVFRHEELAALLPKVMELPSYVRKWGTTFVGPDAVVGFPLDAPEAARCCHIFRSDLEDMIRETWEIEIERSALTGIDLEARVVNTTGGDIAFSGLIIDCSGPAMVVASLLGEVDSVHPAHARWRYFDVESSDPAAFEADLAKRGLKVALHDARQGQVVPIGPRPDWNVAETTILLRAQQGVWCWQIPLFGGKTISVGVVSRHGPVSEELYDEVVATKTTDCFKFRERPAGDHPLNRIHVRNGFARKARRASGEQFVLLSDAFAFSDPVYSIGVGTAVNHAIRLANQLKTGGWSAEISAGFNANAEAEYARSTNAFNLWYAEGDDLWSAEDAERQDIALNGGLFAHSLAREYGILLNDADLATHADPFQRVAGADPLAPSLATSLRDERYAWEVRDPIACAGGVGLLVQHAALGNLDVLVHPLEAGRPAAASEGSLSVSYRSPEQPWPTDALSEICSHIARRAAENSERWLRAMQTRC